MRNSKPGRFVFLVVTLALLPGGPASANLLSNPDFSQWDDDSTPAVWTVEARNYAAVARETDQGHAAPPCLKLTRLQAGTGNNKGVLQNVPVSAGQNYTVSAWFMTPTMPDTLQYVSARVIITWRNSSGSSIGSTNPAYVHQPVWTEETYVAAAPNNPNGDSVAASADVLIRCYGRSSGLAGGIVFADDASLVQGGAVVEGEPWAAAGSPTPLRVRSPAGRSVTILVNLESEARLDLTIHDLTGTERAVIGNWTAGPGCHRYRWNTGTEAGALLPAGVYFVALRLNGAGPFVQKLLVQR